MNESAKKIKILLVDDEGAFRETVCATLKRRDFEVATAATGEEALAFLDRSGIPDIVVLDLNMPGLSGIETLQKIREKDRGLPVLILTGHGNLKDALAGIRLEIVDFLQKPVDIDLLGERIKDLLEKKGAGFLRERTISELMVSPDKYPRLFMDEPIEKALTVLYRSFFSAQESTPAEAKLLRSVLVYDRRERFLGIIRFSDLLKLVLPGFLKASPYTTYFTGMFLAQCKLIARREIKDLLEEMVSVDVNAPLMQAVQLMVENRLINLPVIWKGKLAGILRERDVIQEIARIYGL